MYEEEKRELGRESTSVVMDGNVNEDTVPISSESIEKEELT